MAPFNHQEIEPKWQERWEKSHVGEEKEKMFGLKETLYHLVMFPYPSGEGLHVGHVESYTALDILTRQARLMGKQVLFPIGYDAFGLPAENYAIKTGVPPAVTTQKAIANFRRQMQSLGLSFDWSREISTSDPEYYKWTQWLFLKLYENDLAYRAQAPVNWCPTCQTVLANEQVVDGKCERCESEVVQKELEQWFLRITKYADELLAGLENLDWPQRTKAMQKNWIGKSEGIEIDFPVVQQVLEGNKIRQSEAVIRVFTTRADTLMGVSYLVLAPEHPLVDVLTRPEYRDDVVQYRDAARRKSELERTQLEKDKSGVPIGAVARHPITHEEIPVWIADYALMNYGTGAVMAVPAHDERDFAFAQKYDLPIKQVIASNEIDESIKSMQAAYVDPGVLVNSGIFDGLTSNDAKQKIADALEADGHGRRTTNYRLRDWLISRQRYWGAPIPIIWCDTCGPQPVPESALPVVLPEDVDFKPTGESPLVRSKSFHEVNCPKCGASARRESDTMDTFVDSSWYFLRYVDPRNARAFADRKKLDYWCPVDLYVGGAEHAVMHLLYVRFFTRALHDLGYLKFQEPFVKMRHQGIVLGPDGNKMSKSKGNVVNPDEIVREFGADTIRLYEMFMGPLEDAKPWDTKGAVGVRRFLDKVWSIKDKIGDVDDPEFIHLLHKTVKKVTQDLVAMKFKTAVSQMMIFVNAMGEAELVPREVYETFLVLLSPFAPHLCEELWEQIGHSTSVFSESWPKWNERLVKDELVAVAIQVNGKLRGTMSVSPDLPQDDACARAQSEKNVEKYLAGKEVVKVIYIPGRLINLVVK